MAQIRCRWRVPFIWPSTDSGTPPPSNLTNHTSPTPPGGYPPKSALGPPQPYNSILDERRAFQPVRLRAALVTGLGVRCVGRLREPIYVVGRPFGSNPIRSATNHSQTRDEAPAWAFFSLFQRGLARPSDFRRLTARPKLVSERPASLSIRPSPKSRRIQKFTPFQILVKNGLRRS